jgi:DNA-binding transcriptional ArsR family regulator
MARLRLGIVGPTDSVELILAVAKEREDVFNPLPLVYGDASEVPEILHTHRTEVDILVFSGVVPYWYSLTVPRWNKPLLYIPHTGSSLLRVFLQITSQAKLPLDRISFDTYSRAEIAEAFGDIGLPLPQIYLKDYEGVVSAAELTDFHYSLWAKKQTQIAITCFHKTAEKLKSLGVPAFRIWPTRDNIRRILETAIRTVETIRYSESQIAVCHVAIDSFDTLVRDAGSSYTVNRIEIRLHEILLDFAQQVGGSVIPQGGGKHIIFTTRGRITAVTQDFTTLPVLDTIARKLRVHVSGGIGFGTTAYQAEENAHIAHGLAKRQGQGQWMIVTDDHRAIGPLNAASRYNHLLGGDNAKHKALAKRLRISLFTLHRLAALINELEKDTVGIAEIAARLDITPRSARRVMMALKEAGVAYLCGEESAGKGRPCKLYRFDNCDLLKD